MDALTGSIYMLYDVKDQLPKEFKRLVKYVEDSGLELLLGYDANSHHAGWESSCVNPREESLHEFVSTYFIRVNRKNESTFIHSKIRDNR